MAGGTLARTPHFALHCLALVPSVPTVPTIPTVLTVSTVPTVPADFDRQAVALPTASPDSGPAAMPHQTKSCPAPPLFTPTGFWMGAMVPKRWAKRAVTRNAIKRQIYSVSALAQVDLHAAAHVVRLRAGFDKAMFPSATSDALKAAVRLELGQLFGYAALAYKKKMLPLLGP